MSGTIPLSMTQQLDQFGTPLAGGLLYTIQAGTVSTPQNSFQDGALTLPWPNPIILDAGGRIPQLFLADGLIKIRLTDAAGVTQLVADNVQVIGASSGSGGGGGTVDATSVYQTGDLKPRYGVGAHTGWVRANGLTIGSATSTATEPGGKGPDAQALFIYLYGVDSTLVVSGGRTGNALNDFNANKTIALPDFRGRVIAAMDDMGTTSADRLGTQVASTTLGGTNATNVAGSGTDKARILRTTNLPAYTPAGTITEGAITSTLNTNVTLVGIAGSGSGFQGGSTSFLGNAVTSVTSTQAGSTFTGTAQGGTGAAFSIVQPTKVCTIYIKL